MEEMSRASVLLICIGVLIMLKRSLLLFAPRRTMQASMAMLSTDRPIRILGGMVGALSLSLLMSDFGDSGTARCPMWVLWAFLSVGAFLVYLGLYVM